VLIFGTAGIDAAIAGFAVKSHLMILAALLLGSLVIAPVAAAAALRQALD
jgi:heme exporter protein B